MNAVDIRNEIGGIPVPARFVPSMLRPVGKSTVPGTCLTPVFRVSFPVLSLPKVAPNSDGSPGAGAPTYSLEAIFHPEADLSELEKAVLGVLRTKFSDQEIRAQARPGGAIRLPLREQALRLGKAGYGQLGYFATLRAPEHVPPALYDASSGTRREVERPDADGVFYPGALAYGLVSPYAYNNKGRGASLTLRVLVKVADAPRVAGAAPITQAETYAAFSDVDIPTLAGSTAPLLDGTGNPFD